ncbi:MAG: aldo/keto reductase [Chloroflexi bacterium]|nr:aldo/keto reductase [Chloroflexota bacterium]
MTVPAVTGGENRGRRVLGRTGWQVFPLSLGSGWIGIVPGQSPETSDDIAIATVQRALALGLNYVDTSPSYRGGESERRLGLALQGVPRQCVILATKVGTHPLRPGDYSAAAACWSIEQSLRALNTDWIDVALVHDPPTLEPVFATGGTLAGLERLRAEGLIRAIGIGVQNHEFLRAAILSDRFDVVQAPYDYSLMRTTALPLITLAWERHIGYINASPFQQGLLSGPHPRQVMQVRSSTPASAVRSADIARATAVWEWATARGIDLRTLAIQFCLREQRIATTLVGPRTAEELEEDVAAATSLVLPEHWRALDNALPTFPPPAPGGEVSTGSLPPIS